MNSQCSHFKKITRSCLIQGLVFFALIFQFSSGLRGEQDIPPIEKLLEQARSLKLGQHPEWLTLLHYESHWYGSESVMDDERFFLSPQGKKDANAELQANIRAFFDPTLNNEEAHNRFPARFEWLTQKLNLPLQPFSENHCPELYHTLQSVHPQRATLIFPGTHNNSPASMFGHTLINILGDYKSELLSNAVNYAAFDDGESNGLVFAYKGILGGYKGYFSILPYYQKMREYNDLERRDVWEYRLNLSPEETRRMLLHIWELKDVYADYYFFDENCSYMLLYLLEVARPSVQLRSQCRPWVIPIDTVRIIRHEGLIISTRYRPSKASRIEHIYQQMEDNEIEMTRQLLSGEKRVSELEASSISAEGRRRILELCAEKAEFNYFKGKLSRDEYRKHYLELLKARSLLGQSSSSKPVTPVAPEKGHASNRLRLGLGHGNDGDFVDMGIRPAYHDLMDSDEGYLAGSQIDFFSLNLRYDFSEKHLKLQRFDLVDIISLSPRNPFDSPLSWKIGAHLERQRLSTSEDALIGHLTGGTGFCWSRPQTLYYVMSDIDLMTSGELKDSVHLNLGISLGYMQTIKSWKFHLSALYATDLANDYPNAWEISWKNYYAIDANHGLFLEFNRQYKLGIAESLFNTGFNIYW